MEDFKDIVRPLSSPGVDERSFHIGSRLQKLLSDAKESGNKSEMAKAKVLGALHASIDTEEHFFDTFSMILSAMDTKFIIRPLGYSKHISDSFSTYIHMSYKWKVQKGTGGELGKFLKSRADLLARIKSTSGKESLVWAEKQISGAESLCDFLDLLKAYSVHHFLFGFIADNVNHVAGRSILKLISKDGDIDAWGKEDFAKDMAAEKNIRQFVIEELFRVLCSVYSASVFKCLSAVVRYNDEFPPVSITNIATFKDKEGSEFLPREQFAKYIDDASRCIAASPVWGEFMPLVKILFSLGVSEGDKVVGCFCDANSAVWQATKSISEQRKLFESEISGERRSRKNLEKEVAHLGSKLKVSDALVDKLRRKGGDAPDVVVSDNQDLRKARQSLATVEDALAKREDELARTKQLLNAILSGEGERFILYEKVSLAEVKKKRGIIIGGHVNVTSKLRKELPNCIYYSPDSKTVDEDAVRNADYILFFAGYVNHCLTGHSLRLARINDIPAGYTDRVNINLILDDVMAIFSGETQEV